MGQDPLPASRSCHGNHEGKEGMEWKVSRESLITMGWLPTGQTIIIASNRIKYFRVNQRDETYKLKSAKHC
jgi:hypothetical protein